MLAVGLVSLNGVAVAATGHGLVLGEVNHANKTTTIKRSGTGPALALYSKSSQPPLYVSSGKVVKRLNADKVDGLSASSLQTRDLVFPIPDQTTAATGYQASLKSVPKGIYEASYDITATMTTTGANLDCYLILPSGKSGVLGYGSTFIGYSTVSASSVIDLRKSSSVAVHCFDSAGSFAISSESNDPSVVNLVKIDGLSTGSLS